MALLRRPGVSRRSPLALMWLATMLASPPLVGVAQSVTEPALKAAFLLNFAKFTEWSQGPRPATEPLVLCSADEAIVSALEHIVAGQTIEQHPVSASRVTLDQPLHTCALIYVGKVDRGKVAQLSAALKGAGVLTVGDEQAFATAGGMIGLYVEDGRMRFAINIGATEQGRVRLSAKLLNLARIVKD